MIGELITAGASLLGSIFGKKKQKVETTVDYVKMAQSAQAAGFNPLTALRNGGSAGFTTTTSPTISAMPEALGNLGGVLGNALEKKLDPIEAKKRELDTALVDAQLRSLKQGPQVPGRFYQPRTYTGTKVSQQLVPRLGASSSNKTAAVPAAAEPLTGSGPGGKILPTHTQWRARDGSLVWLPNPDLPDLEQYPIPPLGQAEKQLSEPSKRSPTAIWQKPFHGLGTAYQSFQQPLITSRPVTRHEKKRVEDSWLPGWVPRLNWR